MNTDKIALSRQSRKAMKLPIPTIKKRTDSGIITIELPTVKEISATIPAIVKLAIAPYRNAYTLSI